MREANAKIVDRARLQARRRAEGDAAEEEGAVEQVIDGKTDLAYTVAIEILPPIELADFKGIKLERLAADVTDAEIDEGSRASPSRTGRSRPRARARRPRRATASSSTSPARSTACRSRAAPADDVRGADRLQHLHPGLRGSARRHRRRRERARVKVTFPQHYGNEALAGKDAEFDVTAKSIETPGTVAIDDDFAKSLGLESLAKLREVVKDASPASTPAPRGRSSSARCSTSSTRCTSSRRRRRWSRRNSTTSGRRC